MPAAPEVRRGRLAREEDGPRFLRLRPGCRGSAGLIPDPAQRLDIALAVAVRGRSVLVAKRADESHLGGTWEFPGGKIEAGEEPLAAALRELREETGLAAVDAEPLLIFVHDYPDRRLRFHVFLVREAGGDVATDGDRPWSWVEFSSLSGLSMPEANRAVLQALRWRLP